MYPGHVGAESGAIYGLVRAMVLGLYLAIQTCCFCCLIADPRYAVDTGEELGAFDGGLLVGEPQTVHCTPPVHTFALVHCFPSFSHEKAKPSLYGMAWPLQERQVAFVLRCLQYLEGQYSNSSGSTSGSSQGGKGTGGTASAVHPGVILVGHSMGGVVAHMAALDAAHTPGLGKQAGVSVALLPVCIQGWLLHGIAWHIRSANINCTLG